MQTVAFEYNLLQQSIHLEYNQLSLDVPPDRSLYQEAKTLSACGPLAPIHPVDLLDPA